jgi:enolase
MSNPTIASLHGREVLDSRGNPTVEVEVHLSDGSQARAIVPSGASKGQHEALELRDGDPKRYLGKGTLKAVHNVNETLAKLLVGKAFTDVQHLDTLMLEADGTSQKSKLGANAMLGVSLAYVNAIAVSQERPLYLVINEMMGLTTEDMLLPVPLMNILNGGQHANNGLEIQEFMIVPHGFPSFAEALRAGCEIFHHLKKSLEEKKFSTAVGDEGGFAPALKSNEQALELILEAIQIAGYEPGKQVALALDVASSSFFSAKEQKYHLRYGGQSVLDSAGLIEFYGDLLKRFPIVSIEDGLDEDDWAGWKQLTTRFGKQVQLVGDDLFVTQRARVERGIEEGCANAVLVKVNQVGTLKETFETMLLCRKSQYRTVTSHRSGETEDVTIAHLAVGSGCGQIKTGSASRSERTAKYNELLRIEANAGAKGHPLALARVFK